PWAGECDSDQGSMSEMPECVEDDVPKPGCENNFMVVDTFASEQVRRRVALFVGYRLPIDGHEPKQLIYDMECVARFGFSHIIFIGEYEYGMLFMDCFGRVFHWEDML